MPYFTPPTERRGTENTRRDPLFGRMKFPVGPAVLKSSGGAYTAVETPTGQQIDEAAITYLGGYVYEITDEEAAALTAAGYEVTP